jgi:hypothetical protein
MRRRSAIAVLSLLLVASLTPWAASAQNVHLIGEPTFTDAGEQLTASGKIAGLGSAPASVVLSATGNTTVTCTSPGGNQAPGQNPGQVTVAGGPSPLSPGDSAGNRSFNVTTSEPPDPSGKQAGCPNNRWDADITDVAFTSATLTFRQGGSVVLTVQCTFSSPTTDGAVSSGNVSCTES